MKTLLLFLALSLIAVAAPNEPAIQLGCARAEGSAGLPRPDCLRNSCPLAANSVVIPTSLGAADLTAAVEQERVAQDLYRGAAERWQLPIFSHIAGAESRHGAAFLQLAAGANHSMPTEQAGVYATADARHLYEQLQPVMNGSLDGALKAAALLEETNIADLRALAARASDEPTQALLAQLGRASVHHLGAFVQQLRRRGVAYLPQVLSPDECATLLASGAPAGRGHGYHGGR
jgi:hypothetical protein